MESKILVCPRCSNEIIDYPALSRLDNKTKICTECGVEEAMIEAQFLMNLSNLTKRAIDYKVRELNAMVTNETNELKKSHYEKILNMLFNRLKKLKSIDS